MTSKKEVGGIPTSALTLIERSVNRDQRAAIARLAQQGGMRHPQPGRYFSDDATAEFKESFPVYDLSMIRKAFPQVLEIDFDRDVDSEGKPTLSASLKTGNEVMEVAIKGGSPPANTEELIILFRSYIASQLDLENLKRAQEAFDGLDDD